MKIAYISGPGRGDTDRLLWQLADRLIAQGIRVCGTVQIGADPECEGACDMDVKLLPEGRIIRISQSLGAEAKGCRLDPAALENAVAAVDAALSAGTDCLLINKFGKHEAEGRGFRDTIADALSREIPVLIGLSRLNKDAFHEFTDGVATKLDPRVEVLEEWMRAAVKQPHVTA